LPRQPQPSLISKLSSKFSTLSTLTRKALQADLRSHITEERPVIDRQAAERQGAAQRIWRFPTVLARTFAPVHLRRIMKPSPARLVAKRIRVEGSGTGVEGSRTETSETTTLPPAARNEFDGPASP
jgi:hypothetical protein